VHPLTADGLLVLSQRPVDAPSGCVEVPTARRSLAAGEAATVVGDVDVVVVDGDLRSLPIRFRNVAGAREVESRVDITVELAGRNGGAVLDC
jgi:hypothetical protein